jgi:hypothetical protein
MVHVNINPIKAFVHESVLYDEDLSKKDLIECTVFSVSSYKDESITFGIVLKDGSVFFYIPPHKLTVLRTQPKYELKDLVYHNCVDDEFVITCHDFLKKEVFVYLKNEDEWVSGKYQFTIDWYKDNGLLHLIILDSGQFCLMPSHKVKFNGGEKKFVFYKKMHSIWKI